MPTTGSLYLSKHFSQHNFWRHAVQPLSVFSALPSSMSAIHNADDVKEKGDDVETAEKQGQEVTVRTRDFYFLPIPDRLRASSPTPEFGYLLNIAFGFASTFTVANLYYCQPLLIQFSLSFGVSYGEVSRIPTLTQAGYATGLLFLSPLGDLVPRRQLLLALVFSSGTLTIGMAVTNSLVAFEILSFLVGVVTVTPQVLIPLAADLAPPQRRASAMSIVLAGLLLGVLMARVLAGIIGEFSNWRNVYWMALGLQYFIFMFLYGLLPDYPAKNPQLGYFGILRTMVKFAYTEPVLIQACLISCASSAAFANFWVTLTFLLGGPPYFYSTLQIGLFGLIGLLGVATGPFVGRLIDKTVPWFATMVATSILIIFQSVLVGAAGINIGAVIVACFGLDVGRQCQQVSLTTRVFAVDPPARARMNAVLILAIFLGQVMGTSVGTLVFVNNGWRPAAALSLAWTLWMMAVLLVRGPHCERYTWVGWQGGHSIMIQPEAQENAHTVINSKLSTDSSQEAANAEAKEI